MAFKSQQGVIAHHAAAVVGDAYELPPSAFHRDDDAVCAGVERILQQFLDHRSRPVDHLAGSDLIGYLVRKNVDAAHEILPFVTLAGTEGLGAACIRDDDRKRKQRSG